ncbi:hypothetical protein, partial [Shewanella litorisediminis]|uniref:hypothetical protein n=1 Tax=Shewanella litorisediminis TaxID=1173586 RepID=UPI0036295B53
CCHALHENSFIDKIVLSTSSTCEYPHRLLDKFLKSVTLFGICRRSMGAHYRGLVSERKPFYRINPSSGYILAASAFLATENPS